MSGISFGGLASGLDTNSIITQLMAIERRPRVRLEQRQKLEEARGTALKDVETRLRNLQTSIAGLRDVGTWSSSQSVDTSEATKLGVRRSGNPAAGGYTFRVASLAQAAQTTQANAVGSASGSDSLQISVGGTSITVGILAGDTLQTIADRINGSTDTPVLASVVNDRLVMSAKTTGAANAITLTDVDGGYSVVTDFGLTQTQNGADAQIYRVNADGSETALAPRSSNVVTDLVLGVEVTLKGLGTSTITVGNAATDTDAVKKKVQEFVDQYNSTLEFVRSKLDEEKVKEPKTEADRAKGVLRNDTGLSLLLSRLRSSVADAFTGRPAELDSLAEIGITTGATTGSGSVSKEAISGKLVLDAEKLAEKLTSSFTNVKALLSNVTGAYDSEGIAQRLDRQLDPWLKGSGADAPLIDSRQDSARDVIEQLRDRMAEMDTRLAQREKSLRAQFTAMERALQSVQSQGNWLAGQLG